MATALLTAVLALTLPRTRIGNFGRLVAIAAPSLIVAAAGSGMVDSVGNIAVFPTSLPAPGVPLFFAAVDVLTGALSIAAITLVQGVGVSQSVPNPDGSSIDTSRDFMSLGAANVPSGFFRGLPVGAMSSRLGQEGEWQPPGASWRIIVLRSNSRLASQNVGLVVGERNH